MNADVKNKRFFQLRQSLTLNYEKKSDIALQHVEFIMLPNAMHCGDKMKVLNSYPLRSTWNKPQHDKINNMTCVSSEDSDQPEHLPSLISLRRAING